MYVELTAFRVYPKEGMEKIMNFRHFTLDKLGDSYVIRLYDHNQKPNGALGYANIAAILPQIQPYEYYGYNVTLKNGKSFRVGASNFEIEEHEVVFHFGTNRNTGEPNVMGDVYVNPSEVFSILPVKGLGWQR